VTLKELLHFPDVQFFAYIDNNYVDMLPMVIKTELYYDKIVKLKEDIQSI
jgi:hypothetical protein